MAYVIGLDYGTNSVRCLVVNTANGEEPGTAIYNYETGTQGIILDPADHNLARQNPADYIRGIEITVPQAMAQAKKADPRFSADQIIGIGIDTTGSTPIPVTQEGVPLAMTDAFKANPNAQAWLWKDHTGNAEAEEITAMAAANRPEYLAKCGGVYSSEWFFSKILHCLRTDPAVFNAAYSWLECCDYIPAVLTGTANLLQVKRSRCAAGHKAMFSSEWGGLPDREFLGKLDPKLAQLRERLYDQTFTVDTSAGAICEAWAKKLQLPAGIPVAVGAFDAHLGAVGAGITPGTLVKIIGTSSCDMVVWPGNVNLPEIPGICGIVDGSILPGCWGLEAGQSAVGDIFNWFVNSMQPGGESAGSHESLTQKAAQYKPAQSGLLALDWNNGNRTILVDPRLTGLLIGQTLHTRPEEIYRALIEATAFGALTIIKRFEEYGVNIQQIVNCGGISEKNALFMQIYADVTGREMKLSRSAQTCALGSAIAAAVVAGKARGGYDSFEEAQTSICAMKSTVFRPISQNHKIYQDLYSLYKQLHDAFGLAGWSGSLANVMKRLLALKKQAGEHVG